MVGRGFRKCRHFSSLRKTFTLLLSVSVFAVGGAYAVTTGPVKTEPVKSEPVPAASSLVVMTPEAVNFVDVPVGDTYTQTVRITNLGENTLQIRKIITPNADFRISGILLPVVIAHGTSETFTVTYRARAAGRSEGKISVVTSMSDEPLQLNVKTSASLGQSELTASEASIDFEDVAIGSSGKRELTLTNSGNRDISISEILVSGAGFSVSGGTAVHLSPGQSIGVAVNFTPRNEGHQTGTLGVPSTQGGSTPALRIPLTASGAASSASTVRLNWEESPVTVAGYVVYRSAEASGPYMRVSDVAVPSAEYMDSGLAAGHTYYYVVTSLDENQAESEYSAPISATVPEG